MKRIWITRTEPGASKLAKNLRSADICPIVTPLVEICAIDSPIPEPMFDLAVFLSQHAVRHGSVTRLRTRRYLAIGTGTHSALEAMDIQSEIAGFPSSEGLLKTINATTSKGSSILVVCGADGRSMLASRLKTLDFPVHVWHVYRRIRSSRLRNIYASCETVELSSLTALKHFSRLTRTVPREDKFAIRMFVPSQRIGKQARLLGYANVFVARDASPRSIAQLFRTADESYG